MDESEQKATRLGETLAKHSQAFNFVGLRDGFSDLSDHITTELRFARAGIALFGFMVLVPSGLDLWFTLVRAVDLSTISSYTLGAVLVGTVTMTLLFLYFFRIALRKADSCRAQLVQVRLRMTLCQFIQSYADYAMEIKAKNPDALVPHGATIEALVPLGPVLLSYVLSFIYIGIYWNKLQYGCSPLFLHIQCI